jgi:uncharacterized membrane protein
MGSQAAASRSGNTKPKTQKNIDSILKLEKEDERKLSQFHRVSHTVGGFVGTVHFVTAQCVMVVVWLSLNVRLFDIPPFDPYPFPLLSLVLTLEAVFLTSFVLISQNTMDRRSERRNHLDLQINLLAEEESATTLNILRAVANHLRVDVPQEAERETLANDTPVESIAQDLRKREARAD